MMAPQNMIDWESSRSDALAALSAAFGEKFHRGAARREHFAHDESWHRSGLPDAVFAPRDRDDVQKLVQIANQYPIPLIAFGVGSSLEGHVVPVHGGVSIDFSEMNALVHVHPGDFQAVVQPGLTRKELNEALRHTGLMFTVDPGANATLGGMAATRASGTTTVRYGAMPENIVALEAVMANGQIIRTGQRARKSSAGYDLTRLLIGSEGTLGLITELTLRLHPIPDRVVAAVVSFPSIAAAVSAVGAILATAVPIARIELLDGLAIEAVNAFAKTHHVVAPTLFLEFHGSHGSVDGDATFVQAMCEDAGGRDFVWHSDLEKRNALWEARHMAARAIIAMRPGSRILSTDVCVPLTALPEAIDRAQHHIQSLELYAPLVGHVGDGNFHFVVPVGDDADETQRILDFTARLADDAIALGGTCTGEHGIGLGKQHYLAQELGGAVDIMRLIKQGLDPLGILNPGKILLNEDETFHTAPKLA